MDQRLQSMVERYDELKIGVDEPFQFHCMQCGKCCINREDILLNPRDVFRITRYLRLQPYQFLAQYCEAYIGNDSRMPIVRLKPKGSVKRCLFLKDRKCQIHEVKPTVCALFPIARSIPLDVETVDKIWTADLRIDYLLDLPACGDRSETHTVREWLTEFGISVSDEWYIYCQRILLVLMFKLQKFEKYYPDDTMDEIWKTVLVALYLKYDLEEPFEKQFQENIKDLLEYLQPLWDRMGKKYNS